MRNGLVEEITEMKVKKKTKNIAFLKSADGDAKIAESQRKLHFEELQKKREKQSGG